jgi:hypothetical protein
LTSALPGQVQAAGAQEETSMGEVFGDRILRCSDGHLFVSTEGKRLLGSIHFGAKRYTKCPVDNRWRMAQNVWANDLSATELDDARRYRA